MTPIPIPIPIPDNADLAHLAERANAGLHAHVVDKITALQPEKNANILDLGCGTGALLHRLAGLGYTRLSGIDIAVPPAATRGIVFEALDLDAREMPFADRSFDLIVSVEVFEHVESMGALVRDVARILAPDGTLLLTTPNVHSIEARLRYFMLGKLKQFDEIGDPTHISPIFLHAFKKVLDRHGLEIASLWGFPLDGSSPTSRWSLRVATRCLELVGFKAAPAGDQLCLLIHRKPNAPPATAQSKREIVAGHYGR